MAGAMVRLMRSAKTIRRRRAHGKLSSSITIRFPGDFKNMTPIASLNWPTGWTKDTCRNLDQIAREDRSYIATWSETQRDEKNSKVALNSQDRNAHKTKREDYSEAVKANQRFAPKTVSRKAVEMEYLVRLIFVLVGMDRIAILVGLFKVRGLSMTFIFLQGVFAYKKCRFLCKRREYKQYTAQRTFHTCRLLARGSRCSVLRVVSKNNHPCAHVMFRTLLDLALSLSALSTPTSSSLLFPPDRTNPGRSRIGIWKSAKFKRSNIRRRIYRMDFEHGRKSSLDFYTRACAGFQVLARRIDVGSSNQVPQAMFLDHFLLRRKREN